MDTYTIKEVSEMFHLPSSTLRYYEDLGILTNVGRSKSGQRVYIQGGTYQPSEDHLLL